MRSVRALTFVFASWIAIGPSAAGECPGNPNAIGTHRTIVVNPFQHTRLGSVQYPETLPLEDKEVVLTFDDGPLPPYSTRILDILARECVKATYFMVGKMVRTFPKVVRRTHEEGHTIANHSQNHSYAIHRQPVVDAWREIDDGFESLRQAMGDPATVAPFFRFPGLLRDDVIERFLSKRGVMSWSVDVISDDSSRIGSSEIIRRTITRLDEKGKGIVLLHDIQPATANALPELLRQLKARGYRIVHVVPAGPGRVATPTTPEQWAVARRPNPNQGVWANAVPSRAVAGTPVLDAPSLDSFGADEATGSITPVPVRIASADRAESALALTKPVWPHAIAAVDLDDEVGPLPIPAVENFRYIQLGRQLSKRQQQQRGIYKRTDPTASNVQVTHDAAKSKAAAPKTAWPKAATKTAAPKTTHSAPKNSGKVAKTQGKAKRTRATGHQIQLPKPQASLQD